ncbi:unnamed protein product [Urochloa humidicola]
MRGEPPRTGRWGDQPGGFKRAFEEDRRGGPHEDWEHREEGIHRETMLRDRLQGSWEQRGRGPQSGTHREQWGDNHGAKRREIDHRLGDGEKRSAMEGRGKQFAQGSSSQPLVHDRLGGKQMEGNLKGRLDEQQEYHMKGGHRGNNVGVCRWCGQEGHYQATCTNKPLCFRCNTSGHVASQCPQAQGCQIKMMGFGFPDQGFYSLQIPEAKAIPVSENLACIYVESGEATSAKIEEELKHLIDDKWDWKVKQITAQRYLVEFPNKAMLTAFSKSNGIQLAVHKLSAKITKSTIETTASSILQTGWVKIYNIHPRARTEEGVRAIAELAGRVVVIDELSLIREGPVRVKISGRNINSLRGCIEIFVDNIGHEIKFVAEGALGTTHQPKQPPLKKPDEDSEEEHDAEKDTELEWEKMKRNYEQQTQETSTSKQTKSAQAQGKTKTGGNTCSSRDSKTGKISTSWDNELMTVNVINPLEEIQVSQNPCEKEAFSSQELAEGDEQKSEEGKELKKWEKTNGERFHKLGCNMMLVHDKDGAYWLSRDKWLKLEVNMQEINTNNDKSNPPEEEGVRLW